MSAFFTELLKYLALILPSAAISALCVYHWTRRRQPLVINTPAMVNMHPHMTIVNRIMFIQKANEYRNGRDTIMCRYVNDTFFDNFKDTLGYFMTTTMLTTLLDFKDKEGSEDFRRLATIISFYLQRPIPKELVILDERTMQFYWGFEHERTAVKVNLEDEAQYHHAGVATTDTLNSIFRNAITLLSRIEESVIKYGPLPFDFLLIETAIQSSQESRSALRALVTAYYGMINRVIPSDWVLMNEDTRYLLKLFKEQREAIKSNMKPGIFENEETATTDTKPTHLRVIK